jgi:UV DNA damage endonuclease
MSIGYACHTIGVPSTGIKGCLLKNAGTDTLAELIAHNLSSLHHIVDYNDANDIRLFRISSDIIPFGSSPVNTLTWKELCREELSVIAERIRTSGIRVSMHPGQYTVLNSPDRQVAERAALDLVYHVSFLESLETDTTNKVILHVGGAYGDKSASMRHFAERYRDLDDSVKRRLVIENDDKSYHIGDVLELGAGLGIPVVYDNLHNKINCCDVSKDDFFWIAQCAPSWKQSDGRQKVHYSQQDPCKNAGSHSARIGIDEFLNFYSGLGSSKPDIMLEVKDKNLSAVKCINCTAQHADIRVLETEWSRYKYAVLEKAPNDYKEIRALLKDKSSYPAAAFYRAIDHAYAQEANQGNTVNAALHVWGYFKSITGAAEKKRFSDLMRSYQVKDIPILPIKRYLMRLATKYHQDYLLKSYYFV